MGLTARLLLTLRGGVSAGLGFIPLGRILRAQVLVQKDEREYTHVHVASTHMHAHMDYEVAGGEAMGSPGNYI